MIKNIVFDIGNVLVEFGWKAFFDSFNMPEDVYERVVRATVMDPDWNEIDRGFISEDEVLGLFIENDPQDREWLEKIFKSIHGMLTQYGYAKAWIRELQSKGFKVYCLSNMSYKACRECAESMDFLPMLDGYVLSCDVKMCKPEPGIYKVLFDKYSLIPGECVFVDDLKSNIEAALKQGMKGIVFTGKDEAMMELEKLVEEK